MSEDIQWKDKKHSILEGGDFPQNPELRAGFQKLYEREYQRSIATHLFAQAVSKPVGVNDEVQPDYALIAKQCVEKAKATTPYLLQELGLLPKESE